MSQISPKSRRRTRTSVLTSVVLAGVLGAGVAFANAVVQPTSKIASSVPSDAALMSEADLLAEIAEHDHEHEDDHADHAEYDDHADHHDEVAAPAAAPTTTSAATATTTAPSTTSAPTTTAPAAPTEIIDVEQLAGTDESLPTPDYWTAEEFAMYASTDVATQQSVGVATPQSIAFAQQRDAAILTTARAAGGLPANALGASCPAEQYQIRWETPSRIFQSGDYVGVIRPPAPMEPSATGVVVCGNSTYAFRGFVAVFNGVRWEVSMVWSRTRSQSRPDLGLVVARGYGASNGVDGFPLSASQTTCDPTTKPGVAAFRGMVMSQRGGRDGGIVRNCSIGGRSEHKEGRAWDWMMNAFDPAQKAVADQFVAELTATDANGEVAALARRYGIYYIIWNQQIWTAYSASSGWRPYSGVSPHTDHVHFSFTWDGAMGRTSGFTGVAQPGLLKESEPLPDEDSISYLPGQRQSPTAG